MNRTIATSLLGALAVSLAAVGTAQAQAPQRAGDFERPVGFEYGGEQRPIEASTRDEYGNRLIVNGRIMLGQSSLSGGLMDDGGFLGEAGAVGNQLNVITQGNFNTVIIDSTQINNGDVTAVMQGDQQ